MPDAQDPREGDADPPPDASTPYRREQERLNVDGLAFGRRVRKLRTLRGWTQEALRDRSGVPLMTISDLESGKTATPHPTLSNALAETFGYASPVDLLNGVRPAAPPPRPGPLTLEGLVASLLRGVWAAQEARPEREPAPGAAVAGGTITLAVGVVVLADGRPVPDPETPSGGRPGGPPVVSSQVTHEGATAPRAARRRGAAVRAP